MLIHKAKTRNPSQIAAAKRRSSTSSHNSAEVEDLCGHGEHRVRHEPERPGLEDLVTGHVVLALVGHQAEVQRPPEAIGSELVGIARMIGELVVEPVPVDPTDRIHVDAEGVVHDRDGLDEPVLVVERAMRDPHVDHAGQVHAADEPAHHEVRRADQQADPGTDIGRCEVHAGQRIGQDERPTRDVVDLHRVPFLFLVEAELRQVHFFFAGVALRV